MTDHPGVGAIHKWRGLRVARPCVWSLRRFLARDAEFREHFHVCVEVVIHLADIILQVVVVWGVEDVSARVDAVADCGVIGVILDSGSDQVEPGAEFAGPGRVHRLHLGGRHRVCGAAVIIGAVADGSGAEAVEGNNSIDDSSFDDAGVVVIEEEKRLVFTAEEMGDGDRAANGAAELVLDEVIARNLGGGVVAEPTVGHQRRIAVVLIQVAVKLVCAALGNQFELTASGGSCICGVPRDTGMKLFDRVNRRVTDDAALKASGNATIRLGGVARRKVIDVQAVERDVVLIDACPGD